MSGTKLHQTLKPWLSLAVLSLLLGWGVAVANRGQGSGDVPITLDMSLEDLTRCLQEPSSCPWHERFDAMRAQGGCPGCAARCRAKLERASAEFEQGLVSQKRVEELLAQHQLCALLAQEFGPAAEAEECVGGSNGPVERILQRR